MGVGRLSARRDAGHDALTALALVGALAAGVVLASNVFHSGAEVGSLLFGSLFAVGPGDLALGAAVSLAALAASLVLGPRWLAVGFDPGAASALGVRSYYVNVATGAAIAGLLVATYLAARLIAR